MSFVGSIARFVTRRHYRCSWLLFLNVGAWVGTPLTRILWWGLLLGTAWASNSCDKCSSHGDGGRFSQTNNGRMFICGSPHLGRSACLPLSLDRRIGVCVLSFLSGLFVLYSPLLGFTSLTCCLVSSVVYCIKSQHLNTVLKEIMYVVVKELQLSQYHLLCSIFTM